MIARQIANLLFDSLVTLDRTGHVEAWGANTWTVSPDGLTYTFALRPHQRFSDGTPVIASDYAWSLSRAAVACASNAAYDLAIIKGTSVANAKACAADQPSGPLPTLVGDSIIPVDGANTLLVTLEHPAGYFLAALASASFVLESHSVGNPNTDADTPFLSLLTTGTTGSGGSGMFYVTSYGPSATNHPGTLDLKPNPYWWGRSAGKTVHFSEVDITVHTHDAAFILFQSDQSEAFSNVMPRDEQTLGQPYYHEQPTLEFHGLLFPWHNAPFDDLNARRAFCLAINRDQYNQQILHSDAMPSWHILPQGMDGFNANLRGLDGALTTGDNSLAKHYWQLYLAAHHHQVPSIQLNVLSQSNPDYLKASTLLANTWNQAFGIKTEPDRTAWGHGPGWQNAIQVAQDVAIADYSDPQSILSTFTLLNGAYHGFPTIINLPTLNPLLSQADALYDMSQRFPLYQRAEQLLIDNVAFCPVFQYQSYYRLRTWVKGGFDQTAQLNWPLSAWQNAYIAKH